jgi:SAM-dependent methyltransferase
MANLNSVRPLLFNISEKRLNFVNRFKNGGRLLDVGCGNGYFLELSRKNGWDVFGTEISAYSTKYCHEQFGIAVHSGEILEANFDDEFFDIITLWHTLEHFNNPLLYLQEFHRILKRDGLIFILVPNVKFLLNYLKGWAWIARAEILEHLFFYSTDTLESMLKRAHFNLIHTSIGNIEYIRTCLRQKLLNTFSVLGRLFHLLFKANIAESIRVVAEKDGSLS